MKMNRSIRHGFALMLTLFFIVLMLTFLGVAWRRMSCALRVETVRNLQIQRDQGSIHAIARAMRLLETGLPPANPYVCGVTIDTPFGPCSYTVTFTQTDEKQWSVHSSATQPNDNPLPMPDTFATIP